MATTRTLAILSKDYPVSVDDMKAHSVICTDSDDTLLESYIAAATDYAENFTALSLRVKRHRFYTECWPCCLLVGYGPVRLVEKIEYKAADGTVTLLPADSYDHELFGTEMRIKFCGTAATLQQCGIARIMITYLGGHGELDLTLVAAETGYGIPYGADGSAYGVPYDDATLVPDGIKQAIRMLVAHWYENREAVVVGTITSTVPLAVEALLNQYRVWDLA